MHDEEGYYEGLGRAEESMYNTQVRSAMESFLESAKLPNMQSWSDHSENVHYYDRERYVRHRCGLESSYGHDIVKEGDSLQVNLGTPLSNILSIPDKTCSGTVYFFYLLALFGIPEYGIVMGIVKRLENSVKGNQFRISHVDARDKAQFLPMKGNVRRAAKMHIFQSSGGCVVHAGAGRVTHDGSFEDGDHYILLGRNEGYPPHMG